MPSEKDVTNVIGALRHHDRVCQIHYIHFGFEDSTLNEFAAIDEPFPALTVLNLITHRPNVPVLPDSFLGGSAPRLRSLDLLGIPYPSIGNLLSSTTNLVRLCLRRIPHSGYISPETIVPCWSALATLESLYLGFQYPRSQAHRANRHPPPLTRIVLPNLTSFDFHGDIEYLEDILSQIETPMLNHSDFCFFNQLVFDTPLLGHFIRRTETFMTSHSACVEVFNPFNSAISIRIGLSEHEEMAVCDDLLDDEWDGRRRWFGISCEPLDWQLSALVQVSNSFVSLLSTLENLKIGALYGRKSCDWQGKIEAIQWQELLHLFTAVKKLTLESEDTVRLVAPALQELAVERATDVLPALQSLVLDTEDWRPSGPVKEAIEQFIAARQLCGHPVTVHYLGLDK